MNWSSALRVQRHLVGAVQRAAHITLFVASALLAGQLTAHAANGDIHVVTVTGVINPLTARYLERELATGTAADAQVVVVELNTPGGLETSMREMTQVMLNSPVPVVVYVAPPGARAASAGMFITLAAHVAAMAPGTNIGAAHPVGLGGETDPVMAEKLVNDAAAFARAIATERGRNAAWAEQAVRESVALSAEEALDQGVIDLIARDRNDLLRQLNGREITTTAGTMVLTTTEAQVSERTMSLPERILQAIIDPNVAYILFTIGVVGIIAELYSPGMLFPGLTGVIALILAFTAFGSLPINWAGVALLGLAIALFVTELYTEGIGIAAAGGVIAFILGSLLLYTPFTPTSPVMPDLEVSRWLVAAITAMIGAVFLAVFLSVRRARQAPILTGGPAMIGRHGTAVSELAPAGTVRVDSETWSAVAEDVAIPVGQEIEVTRVEGVTLTVKPV